MQRITQITRGRPSRPLPRRSFYSHSSDYVTLGRQGEAVKRAVDIWVGDPHEAFVLVPKEIGKEMKTTIDEGTSSSSSFAAAVKLQQQSKDDGSGDSGDSTTSPATLHLFGATHTITLDGTPD
ncbi:MAG: hypothetical protein M1815_004674, partial [Lichina confinis]